jgi:hypothetical protein
MLEAMRQFVWTGENGAFSPAVADVEACARDAGKANGFVGINIFTEARHHHSLCPSEYLTGFVWRRHTVDANNRSNSILICPVTTTGMSAVRDLLPDG